MRRRIPALSVVACAAVWLLSFFWPLLSPGRALANRDIPLFHLPLRAAFRHLAGGGLPVWNPWLHGGQPILSNPNYAAFYPPSWLVFAVPPAYALSLLAVLHAAVAFAGAWFLARRLGAGRGAAALAALGYTGSGALLSLLSAFTLFCSMAWFPWVLAWGDVALQRRSSWLRPALLCGGGLALQLLNGEPVTVVVSGLGLLALGMDRLARRPLAVPATVLRTAFPVLMALALAAVQLLPTWGRLADSPRAGGLSAERATTWSAPPARLVELAFPRFFGDPARPQAGYFFGWNLHDRDFPYVASLYPGLLLTVLGVCALALWPIARRGAWALGVLTGAFLALGRHNPLFEGLREAVPVLGVLRYPEKFAILAVVCLGFAGALGWQRLMAERAAGRHAAADFPLALAGVLLATALTLTGILYASPRLGLWFVRTHGGPDLSDATALLGLATLRAEGWAAILTAALVTALLAACRSRRFSGRTLTAAALVLLAADLWHYGHGFVVTLPAAEYRQAPPLAAAVAPESRLFIEPLPAGQPELFSRAGDPRLAPVRALLARLEPYSGSLWEVPYAFHQDFDLMLTDWGRRSQVVLHREWAAGPGQRGLAWRFLGAWNVGTLFLRKDPARHAAEMVGDPKSVAVEAVLNPYVLPRHRFVPRVRFHDSWGSALAVARQQHYAVARQEHCVREGEPQAEAAYPAPPQPLELRDGGGRLELRYRSAQPAFFVVAATWDRGWEAALDGAPLRSCPTALGQIGVELPAGEHRLVLAYRERLLPAGTAVTGLALIAWTAALVVLSRRERNAGVES